MNEPRQRHWENRGQPGQLVFVTTKCLDWAPVFTDPLLADEMVHLMFQVHAFHGAQLHAYVVMPEHLHFISRLPPNQADQKFVGLLKSFTENQLHTRVSFWQESRFDQQRGLNSRFFWERSFRSIPILTSTFFSQKVHYIHWNPVRRILCANPNEYKWSSARIFEEGQYSVETGLMHVLRQEDASAVSSVVASEDERKPPIASTDGAVEASDNKIRYLEGGDTS